MFYIDDPELNSAKIKAEAEKREEQAREVRHFDALSKLRREEREEKEREQAEINFKLTEKAKFLEVNRNASSEDFELLYKDIRKQSLLANYQKKLADDVPEWYSEMN